MGSGLNVLDSAIFSIRGTAKADNLPATPNINVYSFAPANSNAVVAGDFDSLGSTALSTAITFAGYSTTGYNDFTLNADGRAQIAVAGITRLGIRNANYDVANVVPAWSSGSQSDFSMNMADAAGTSTDPKLVVTYTPGTADDFAYII